MSEQETRTDAKNTHQGHKLKIHFRLPIVEDRLEHEDLKNKSKDYNLINGKRVLNTDEIPFHKGRRPQSKKSREEKQWGQLITPSKPIQLLLSRIASNSFYSTTTFLAFCIIYKF